MDFSKELEDAAGSALKHARDTDAKNANLPAETPLEYRPPTVNSGQIQLLKMAAKAKIPEDDTGAQRAELQREIKEYLQGKQVRWASSDYSSTHPVGETDVYFSRVVTTLRTHLQAALKTQAKDKSPGNLLKSVHASTDLQTFKAASQPTGINWKQGLAIGGVAGGSAFLASTVANK